MLLCALTWTSRTPAAESGVPRPICRIEVVEKGSGWPVPLVELRTTHHVRLVSDNAGVIAFDLPELMGRETWFDVIGHGYEVPRDGFGSRGVRLKPAPGATLRVEVRRTIIAKRLGRLTGGGLFGESQKLGQELDWRESGVRGCDSVQNAVHRGKLFWAWGDTIIPNYVESFGKPSAFGELWYAEADAPLGPWGSAVKILTHERRPFCQTLWNFASFCVFGGRNRSSHEPDGRARRSARAGSRCNQKRRARSDAPYLRRGFTVDGHGLEAVEASHEPQGSRASPSRRAGEEYLATTLRLAQRDASPYLRSVHGPCARLGNRGNFPG